jgi:hypothetical protein
VADDYSSLAAQVFALYDQGRFEEALEVVDEVRNRFPDRADRAYYWTACLRCVSGDPDGGLRSLEDGLAVGCWFVPEGLRSDDDLAALRGRPEFEAVVEESERRWRVARSASQVELQVLRPEVRPRAVLVALHGGDARAEDTTPTWQAAVRLGMVLAVPQSSQLASVNGYGWWDRKITEDDLGEVYGRLVAEHSLDDLPIVLGGFSQGGGVALTLAIDGRDFPVQGFIAVAPGFLGIGQPRTDPSEAASRGVRGVVIVGEQDKYRPEGEDVQRRLAASGVVCHLVVEPGVAHEIPPGFDDRLEAALDFILTDDLRASPSNVFS